MILPAKGKYLCEVISRDQQLPSGLWISGKPNSRKEDNVCRCLGAGDPTVKTCYSCHDKKHCRRKCRENGKPLPLVARRGDILHFKKNFGQFICWEEKRYVFLQNQDIVAIERVTPDGLQYAVLAPENLVIVRLVYADSSGSIVVPDRAKMYSGEFWGDVRAVGPSYPDKSLQIGDRLIYLRNEGYKFQSFFRMEELYAIKECWIYARG